MNARQVRFAEVYDGNGVAACRLAGYEGGDTSLAVQAGRLLRNVEVAAAIKTRREKEGAPLIATRQQRQSFWAAVMGGMVEQTLPDGSVMKLPVEMKDRLKASELLGRSEADFTDKLAGADGKPLQVTVNIGRTVKR